MVLAAEARRSLRNCARFCRSWFSLSGPSGLPDLRAARPGDALRPIFLLRAAFPALFRPPTSSWARVLPAGPSLCWEAVEGQAMVLFRCWPSAPPRRPNSTAPTIPPDLDATESAHMQSHVRSRAHLSNSVRYGLEFKGCTTARTIGATHITGEMRSTSGKFPAPRRGRRFWARAEPNEFP